MTFGIGAGGLLGVALEATPGTYVAPQKFVPIENESLQYTQETVWRRPIRQSADVIGGVAGNAKVEGDIAMEALDDCVPYFLHAARTSVVKSGTVDLTYVYTPTPDAVPAKTLSITVVRNDQVFGYVGCVVSSFTFTVEDGLLKFNCSIVGRTEDNEAMPTGIVWPTSVPYGAGSYSLEIPTGTPVTNSDNFEFQVEDNAEAQYRLKNDPGAAFVTYGERDVTLSIERDFEDLTQYAAFKALTAQSLTLAASKGATNGITLLLPATITDTYEVGLAGQGDLLRASVSYRGVIDAAGKAYEITVKTQEDII